MSGLLGGFDGALQGLTEAEVASLAASITDQVEIVAEPSAPKPARPARPARPAQPEGRHVDPRAQAVADRLLGRAAATSDPSPVASAAPPAPARLRAAVGDGRVECDGAAPIVIGRATGDLVVPLGVVSRRHCAVGRDAAGYTVVDLGSANGTLVCRPGGVVVPVGTEPVSLRPGDVIATARGRRPIAQLEAIRGTV